jgi:hypothetical protein
MNSRFTLLMTIAVLVGFAVIIMINIASFLGIVPSKYISSNDVRGMAVEHHDLLYTLNFEQQNTLVDVFNRSIPVTEAMVESRKMTAIPPIAPQIQRIILYRFSGPDIEIRPVAYVAKSSSVDAEPEEQLTFVFSVPAWNPTGLLEEAASDELYRILSKTYDP